MLIIGAVLLQSKVHDGAFHSSFQQPVSPEDVHILGSLVLASPPNTVCVTALPCKIFNHIFANGRTRLLPLVGIHPWRLRTLEPT